MGVGMGDGRRERPERPPCWDSGAGGRSGKGPRGLRLPSWPPSGPGPPGQALVCHLQACWGRRGQGLLQTSSLLPGPPDPTPCPLPPGSPQGLLSCTGPRGAPLTLRLLTCGSHHHHSGGSCRQVPSALSTPVPGKNRAADWFQPHPVRQGPCAQRPTSPPPAALATHAGHWAAERVAVGGSRGHSVCAGKRVSPWMRPRLPTMALGVLRGCLPRPVAGPQPQGLGHTLVPAPGSAPSPVPAPLPLWGPPSTPPAAGASSAAEGRGVHLQCTHSCSVPRSPHPAPLIDSPRESRPRPWSTPQRWPLGRRHI